MSRLPVTPLTKVLRMRERGKYDRATIFSILNEPHAVAHVAFVSDDSGVVCLPTLFAVDEENQVLYVHGSVASHMIGVLNDSINDDNNNADDVSRRVCVTVTLMDAWVLAKSLFHHSANYRSVVMFCSVVPVSDEAEKLRALLLIADHAIPGRSKDARLPNKAEMKATAVVKLRIDLASAKVRAEGVKDIAADLNSDQLANVWTGIVPINTTLGTPVKDAADPHSDIPLPSYIKYEQLG
jgi:nitroimidazol reductase NimA-like FMN-containing flavoprotein (pyridoxamine 5'-phosphate oxidase superfamily)